MADHFNDPLDPVERIEVDPTETYESLASSSLTYEDGAESYDRYGGESHPDPTAPGAPLTSARRLA